MNVIPQGLTGLLLIALEVPGVPWADVHPLEIPDEDPLEVRPVTDAVVEGILATPEHVPPRKWEDTG